MAVNEGFLGMVEEKLSDMGDITVRKMFGGAGIMHQGKMFGLVYGASLYFKTDDQIKGLYENKGMGKFKPFEDREMRLGYHEVPPDVLENKDTLQTWARWSVEIAKRAN